MPLLVTCATAAKNIDYCYIHPRLTAFLNLVPSVAGGVMMVFFFNVKAIWFWTKIAQLTMGPDTSTDGIERELH
eukprot:1121443-Amphidinium_carterae.1